MEPRTIDEYQELVRELKAKIRKGEKKNLELVIKLTDKTKANEKGVKDANIEQAISLNKKAVRIQTLWRGYRQRRAFRQELRRIAKSDLRGGVKINTNSTALAEIETAVKKIGLNLEMLFRACDSEGKEEVTLEEFKLFLKRLDLKKVSQAQINRFLHAIDEDCTGIISKDEYHNCLAAYGVHAEAKRAGSSTRTYEQECVIKFAAVLKARDVRPEEVYNFCDVDQTGTVSATQLAKFIGNLSEPFQEKEIRGLVQYLDVDNNRKIPREVFIRELEKGMRVAGDDYKFKSPSRVDRYDDEYRSPPKRVGSFGTEIESGTEYEQRIKKGTKRPIELRQSDDYSSGPKKNVDTPQFRDSKDKDGPRVIKPVVVKKPVIKEKPEESQAESELKLLKKIIVKMEMASKPVYQFLEKILLGMKDGAKGVTEAELKKTLDQDYAKVLTQDERTELVKDLDLNSNKSVDANEIKSFYVTMARESKEKVISSKLLLISIAKSADAEKKSTEDFLKGYGIVSSKRYAVDEFQDKLNPLFDLPDEAAMDVFADFNDRGTGTVNVASLVETINSFRTANVEVKKPANGGDKKPVAGGEKKPDSKSDNNNNMESAEITNQALKKIIVKMEMDSKPIYLFLEKLLLSIKDSKAGISQAEAVKLLEKDYSNKIVSEQDRSTLISVLDSNTNGVVDFFEVKKFYITMARQSKEKVVSSRLLLISVAKTADAEKKSTEDFLKGYGILSNKRYTVDEFRDKINPLFDLPETSDVYKEFNDKGTGTVNVAGLIETINSFRTGQGQANGEIKKPATGGDKKPDNNNMDSAEITNQALKKIIVKMEMDSKPVYLFLEKLLLSIKDSKAGISQAEAVKLLEKDYSNKIVSEQDRSTLISVLDSNTNGVVDFFEVKKFYITMARQSKEKIVSSKLLLISVAKTADTEKKSTEDFLKGYGILSNKRYTVDEFRDKINPLFDLPETSDVYKEFNDKGTGTVNVASLIEIIDSFRSTKIPNKSTEDKTKTPPKKNDTQKAPAVLPENIKDLLGIQIVETIEKAPKLETKDFKKALVQLELEDAPISWLLELLLQEMSDPKKGLPRTKVKAFLNEKSGRIFEKADQLLETIMNKLDSDQEGIINVDDVQSFINSNAPVTKEVMITKELMIILFAKIAQAELLNTDKFFENYGIRTYKKVSLVEFKTKMTEAVKPPPHYQAELWEEFNHNGTGYVEIVDLMNEINEYRTDLGENGKISYKASVQNVLEHLIYKAIIDEDQEKVALESRAKNEETMDTFKKILKDKGIKPLEFFNVASKGSPTCTSAAFKNAILLYKTSLTDDDITRIIKNIDVNQNQTLDFKFYEMVFMDDEALQSFKAKARAPRGAEEIDPISLGKIKDLLSELNKTQADFFKECDTKGKKEITLVQLKAGIRRMFPCSRLYYSDVLKVMRSMDVQYSGVVTEKTFNSVMSKAKSGGGGSLLNEITKAINSINDDDDQVEDLKNALNKLKIVVNNPKYQNKPEELFKLFDLDRDQVVTRDEFLKALDGLDSKVFLSERQKVLLVNLADRNKNNQIEYAEFLELVAQVNPNQIKEPPKDTIKITVPLERRSSGSRPSSVAEILDNIDQEANEQNFAKYMESIRISASDYYKSDSTTIFNNQIACLKRCYEIIKDMEKRGVQAYDDPDFGPKDEKDHAESSLYANAEERPGGYPDPENILWFRMKDICPDKRPCFLDLDVNTNDVIQGEIGDCWLIGGFSVLATQDDYIRGFFEATAENLKAMKNKEMTDDEAYGMQTGLYPPMFHWLRKYGIYVIRFFRDYSWRYVIIDDKLPCYKYREDSAPVLVFGKCRNHNEFWVPLLEKAYAKLHSCYENLIAGYIDDGLADMTGLVANKITLQGPNGFPSTQVGSAESLWQKLMEFKMNDTMLGCSVKGNPGETEHEVMIDDEPVGILKNHAYSIIDVIELPNPNARNAHKSHRLLRIRNPWGTKEWNGKWSDGSPKLLQNIARLNGYLRERAKKKKIEEFDPEADDGTFLICYKDWRYIYHNLYCCVNFPDEWSGIRFEDEWTKENSGGTPLKPDPDNVKSWAKNPQFVVTINHKVKKTTKMFISLGQKDGRTVRGMKFPFKDNINAVVFTVASLKAGEKKLEAFDGARIKKLSAIKEYRDVSIDIELENGTYVIVPSTQKAGSTGRFFLSVYFECPKEDITIKKAGSDLKGEIIQEEEETALTTDKDLKAVLKLKTLAILCEDELEASLERSLSKSKSRKDSGSASIMDGGSVNSISSPYRKVKSQSISGKGGDRTPRSVMNSEQANQMFNDIMRGIGLNDSDFFREGCTTILNNGMAALKRCHELLRQMNQEGKRVWIDTEFGPKTNQEAGLEFICNEPDDPPTWVKDPTFTNWLHIKDVCPPEKHPHFIANGADSGDVIQGGIGDCWLIGAMSVLASNNDAYIRGNFKPSDDNLTEIDDAEAEAMTKGLYPPMFHWLRQFGIYVIRFFKNYEWRYVIIDDRIPCLKEEDYPIEIIYGKCLADDEFWVPLVEKAYAKLHHTYEALKSGFIDDGLTDMTGMASNKKIIQNEIGTKNERKKKDDLWDFLIERNKQGSMMGCSIVGKEGEVEGYHYIDGEASGLIKGHAYSIIDVFELPAPEQQNYHKSHRIVRLRNPWGKDEWKLKWSDVDAKFAEKIHKIEKYMREEKVRDPEYEILDTNAPNDGTFLMCYKDWRTHFNNLLLCIDFPTNWSGYRFRDQWTKENSGGFPNKDPISFAKNPQFILEVTKPTKIFVGLGQPDGRLDKGGKFPFIEKIKTVSVFIMKLNKGEEKEGIKEYDAKRLVQMFKTKRYRDNSMYVDLPEAGAYAIIPSTQLPREVGPFFLNIYFGLKDNEFKLFKAKSSLKYEMILEEEEGNQKFDDNLKLVLKLKAREVIYESEAYLQEKTLSQIFD